MTAARSRSIIAIGVLHTAVAFFFGGPVYLAVLRDGLIGAVEPDLRRMYWFWFLISGLALLAIGHFGHWVEARLGRRLPKRLGWALLLLGLLASAAIPVSGGWLVAAAGLAILWQPAVRSPHRLSRSAAVALLLLASTPPCFAQQVPDTAYSPPAGPPDFPAGAGPKVLIDAAHLNFHTAEGSYRTFATLLRRAGYRVESSDRQFTRAALEGAEVMVVANAMHAQSRDGWAPLPNLSAFSGEEIGAVEEWVREGGSLLLIADHMPLAGHGEALAAAFGIRFLNGFALDRTTGNGRITFRRSDGSLPPSVIADGRSVDERVDSVTTFTGQAFRVDPHVDAEPVLVLAPDYEVVLPVVAWEFSGSTPRVPAAYLLQGVLVRHGRGRVAVFGEAAMFSAQLAGPRQVPAGMNDPAAGQNYRFALNLMLWLSGRL